MRPGTCPSSALALLLSSGCAVGLVPRPEAPRTTAAAVAVACDGARAHATTDLDGDGLDDACEAALAEAYAPVILHSSAETNLPTDVDDFLTHTSLAFRDDACRAGADPKLVRAAPVQTALLGHTLESPCDGARVTSDGSRSDRKRRTFFLTNVDDAAKRGSADPRRWRTYVHAYPNDRGGVTLQYWRVYTYNRAFFSHGGDWEGVHVVLGADRTVASVGLLGHTQIEAVAPSELAWEGTHPVVYSEIGGHTSRARGDEIPARGCVDSTACAVSFSDLGTFIRQETWTGGRVVAANGRVSLGGGLVNVGEKSAPMNGQVFIRYSGLWGSPGRFYFTSGYWGPAYNETSERRDGFITAWCAGMAGPLDLRKECWAAGD